MGRGLLYLIVVFCTLYFSTRACQCPVTTLSLAECKKYEVIFKGRVDSVRMCENNLGEAFFELQELYKGNATKRYKILFECGTPCALSFQPGEEWIIYSRYKQIGNAKMDWCSRSRKFFKVAKEDFYATNYGNSYDEEVVFLRQNLGLHRFLAEVKNSAENRNERPSSTQMIIILICSLGTIILFYWLFNKFFKF
jgi:hypothetical protein